jgi:hypothetical protein
LVETIIDELFIRDMPRSRQVLLPYVSAWLPLLRCLRGENDDTEKNDSTGNNSRKSEYVNRHPALRQAYCLYGE